MVGGSHWTKEKESTWTLRHVGGLDAGNLTFLTISQFCMLFLVFNPDKHIGLRLSVV